jgi:hypothetical protein
VLIWLLLFVDKETWGCGFWGESKLFTCIKTSLAPLASISCWSSVQ